MPKATFVLGPPASGKTTFVKKELPDAVHVVSPWQESSQMVGLAAREAERTFKKALAEQKDVAVESVSAREARRRADLAARAGYEVNWHVIACRHPRKVTPEAAYGTFRCLDCGVEGTV